MTSSRLIVCLKKTRLRFASTHFFRCILWSNNNIYYSKSVWRDK